MNIFYLDPDPAIAAALQCDRHVIKMALESAQMLSTVYRNLLGTPGKVVYVNPDGSTRIKEHMLLTGLGEFDGMLSTERCPIYWASHVNHPCTLWAGSSESAYCWLLDHMESLCREYTFRYSKRHKVEREVYSLLTKPPYALYYKPLGTLPPTCMPDEFKCKSVAYSYWKYYKAKKQEWDERGIPMQWKRGATSPLHELFMEYLND